MDNSRMVSSRTNSHKSCNSGKKRTIWRRLQNWKGKWSHCNMKISGSSWSKLKMRMRLWWWNCRSKRKSTATCRKSKENTTWQSSNWKTNSKEWDWNWPTHKVWRTKANWIYNKRTRNSSSRLYNPRNCNKRSATCTSNCQPTRNEYSSDKPHCNSSCRNWMRNTIHQSRRDRR